MWFLLFILVQESGGEASMRPRWDFLLTLKGWYSESGANPKGLDQLSVDEKGFAPSVEFEAVRNQWLLRLNIQFETEFRGEIRTFDFRDPSRTLRNDSELAVGRELGNHQFQAGGDAFYRVLIGYKSLVLRQDDLFTSNVLDDFKSTCRGPFVGVAGVYRKLRTSGWDWSLKGMLAFAYLETEHTEKEARTFVVQPYYYGSDGVFADISFNLFLPSRKRDIQLLVGYKFQHYNPREDSVTAVAVRQLPNGFERETFQAITESFEAEGWITGISFTF